MAVKDALILCLALYKLTSSIKFAGQDCTKTIQCAGKDYSSKCVCDFGSDEDAGEKYFKRGLCMDDPPDTGSCMTKFKWTKILAKRKKKPNTAPTGGKYKGESCSRKSDCLKTGDKGCTCPKGKCFGKNCKVKLAYKGETCKKMNDCFNSDGSKCTCPRGKCFGVYCMTEEQAMKAKAKPKVETPSAPIAYKNEPCKKMSDCFNSGGSKCTCPRDKCFGVHCMTEEQAMKAKTKQVVKKKSYTPVKKVYSPKKKSYGPVKKFNRGFVAKKKKGKDETCKKLKGKRTECAKGCTCMGFGKYKKCRGYCAKTSDAQFGDFGDEMYSDDFDGEMYSNSVTGFTVLLMGIVSLCVCGLFCCVIGVVMGGVGYYLGKYAGEYGYKSVYSKLSQRDGDNDVEYSDAERL